MRESSRPSLRSSGLRLLHRLLSVLAALVVLSLSGRAAAATTNPVVPMCGDRNESIAAPPIFRAREPGSIVALPCHSMELEAGQSAPPVPERIVVQERPERVLSFSSLYTRQSASSRLAIERDDCTLDRPGFANELLRPPRG